MRGCALATAMVGILVLVLVMSSTPAVAHPPKEVTVIYNDRLEILTVAINHDVRDGTTHYIMCAEVYLNNALVIERPYEEQARDRYNERFALVAKEGDRIKVRLCCNIEGCVERELVVGKGLSMEGDQAEMIGNMIYMHAGLQISALLVSLVAIPGGMHFFRAWKRKTKPTGKRRRHIRIGGTAVVLWGLGSLGGMYIVYMTSGDYLGSPHGWMALATFVAALFAGWSASPTFRKAGYGVRMESHVPLALLAIVMAVITMIGGMMMAGII